MRKASGTDRVVVNGLLLQRPLPQKGVSFLCSLGFHKLRLFSLHVEIAARFCSGHPPKYCVRCQHTEPGFELAKAVERKPCSVRPKPPEPPEVRKLGH